MGTFGGKSPYPRRFGGGRTRTELHLGALNDARGNGLDTTERTKNVYVENMAIARAIACAFSQNARLSHLWDPSRMTDSLARWEKIFGIITPPNESAVQRRERIALRFERIGAPAIIPRINTQLAAELGTVFVQLEFISLANANIIVPDGTWPFGAVAANPTEYPWYSSICHILVKTQKPANYTEGDYYAAVAKVDPIMDALVPVWVTFDWYRAPLSTPINVAGGPSAGGFYLDDEHNLDNNVFDV